MKIEHPYEERPITYKGLEILGGCSVKIYGISHKSNNPPDKKDWELARQLFISKRKEFEEREEDSDLGYMIVHKGMDCNYIVCSWWAFENMIRMFSFMSTLSDPLNFMEVKDGLGICVWDMLIHQHERQAFVNHLLLDPKKLNKEAYVRDIYPGKK